MSSFQAMLLISFFFLHPKNINISFLLLIIATVSKLSLRVLWQRGEKGS